MDENELFNEIRDVNYGNVDDYSCDDNNNDNSNNTPQQPSRWMPDLSDLDYTVRDVKEEPKSNQIRKVEVREITYIHFTFNYIQVREQV